MMTHVQPRLAIPIAVVLAALPAFSQTTYTVDRDPTAGADFIDVQGAVNAAVPGDVILVAPGSYPRFHLAKGLTILGTLDANGDPMTSVTGSFFLPSMRLTGLPLGEMAVVDDIELYHAEVVDCDGTVVLDQVLVNYLKAARSSDLRVHRNLPPSFPTTSNFDVELTDCVGEVVAADSNVGMWVIDSDPLSAPESSVHFALPTAIGENAEVLDDPQGGCLWRFGSRPGLLVDGGSVVVSGDEESLLRGGAESAATCGYEGPSTGLYVWRGGTARVGPVTLEGGGPSAGGSGTAPGSTITRPMRGDPSLEIVGTPYSGTLVWFKIYGEPGDTAFIHLGRSAARSPLAGSAIDRLTTENRSAALGIIPPNGVIRVPWVVPAVLPTGLTFFLQSSTEDSAGARFYSNSSSLTVR